MSSDKLLVQIQILQNAAIMVCFYIILNNRIVDLHANRACRGGFIMNHLFSQRCQSIRYTHILVTTTTLVFLLLLVGSVQAAVIRPFTPRFTTNDSAAVLLIGNTSGTCATAVSSCANAQNGVGNTLNNNSFDMVYVDIDSDPTTFNSSSAILDLPPDTSELLWAGLYWGGDVNNGTTGLENVQLRTPTSSGYLPLVATQLDATQAGGPQRTRYQGFIDVTDLVREAGSGAYTTANVQSTAGNRDGYAGWSMVIIYQDPMLPLRNITIFDGFAYVTGSDPDVVIPVSGFLTPLTGSVNTTVGVVAYEGDRGLIGDQLQLNGVFLSNNLNPINNFFNSSNTDFNSSGEVHNPSFVNQMGLDVDIIAVNNVLGNGATSAEIRLSTNSDAYYPGVVTFRTDIYAPLFNENPKSVVDINGGDVRSGDILEYTVQWKNIGIDTANNIIFHDAIPANTTYLPNSLVITTGANSGPKSDNSSDDQAEFDATANQVVFRLGTGANAVNGGTVATDEETILTFRVIVNPNVPSGTIITNVGELAFVAATTGTLFTTPTNEVSVVVASAPTLDAFKRDDLIVDADNNGFASAGDTLNYTIAITNTGNITTTNVIFTDTPDPNTTLLNGTVTATQGDVVLGNTLGDSSISVNIGDLPPAEAVVIRFDVVINVPLPSEVTEVANQGTITSDTLPPEPTDDPDTPVDDDPTVTPVQAAPDLVISKSDGLTTAVPGDTLIYAITYSNSGTRNATGAVITETVPLHTTFSAAGSSSGWSCASPTAGSSCLLTVGNLAVAASGTTDFAVTVETTLAITTTVQNVAVIGDDGLNGDDLNPENNQATDDTTIAVPTAVELTTFTIEAINGRYATLLWITAAEIDNFGFRLYRSSQDDFASATPIHFEPSALAGGNGPGATYRYRDQVPVLGSYWYWLEDIDTQGQTAVHGPIVARVFHSHTVYLPFIKAH
jgi:uncharacterized repeat protein (TIGR01451 family)